MKLLVNVLNDKCPYCGKVKIFTPGKKLPFQAPDMMAKCSSCGKNLEGEPGYFFGAMYLSYGLAVLEGILMFLLLKLLAGIQNYELIIGSIILVIFLLSNKNLRISRLIWLKIFPHSL